MIKGIKRNYKKVNIVILCLCLYLLFFPFIARVLENISPKLTQCPFLIITGKPCPLCGGTRFISGLSRAFIDSSYLFNFFGILIIINILEIIFRTINIFKKTYSDKIINIDIIIHFFMFLMYTFYELYYIIRL